MLRQTIPAAMRYRAIKICLSVSLPEKASASPVFGGFVGPLGLLGATVVVVVVIAADVVVVDVVEVEAGVVVLDVVVEVGATVVDVVDVLTGTVVLVEVVVDVVVEVGFGVEVVVVVGFTIVVVVVTQSSSSHQSSLSSHLSCSPSQLLAGKPYSSGWSSVEEVAPAAALPRKKTQITTKAMRIDPMILLSGARVMVVLSGLVGEAYSIEQTK